MYDFFVFNGDADGLCAQQQFGLSAGEPGTRVSGVKRDVALLTQIDHVHESRIAVFDISVEQNLPSLQKLLANACEVIWFDHHMSRSVPVHPRFKTHIKTEPTVNTSLLVDEFLGGEFGAWAVAGLFGDNLGKIAFQNAASRGIDPPDAELLMEFGELLNYNAHGAALKDLYFSPVEIGKKMAKFENPLDFIKATDILNTLREGRRKDFELALNAKKLASNVYALPNEKWARRVSGEFANSLSRKEPSESCAVLVENGRDGYLVSVRAPMDTKKSVAEFVRRFRTGGGRMTAGGINHLPSGDLVFFLSEFKREFGG